MKERVAVIDFETTGLSPTMGARATEIAGVIIEDGNIVDQFQSLMNAGAWISPFIESYTGISNEMIRKAPKADKVMGEFSRFIGKLPLIAHNASFDKKFLVAELERIGQRQQADMLCSLKVARRLYPKAPNHKLETLVQFTGIKAPGAHHRALFDADVTARLWVKMEIHLQSFYKVTQPDIGLMRQIQSTPKAGVGKCIERYRNK